MTVGETAEFPSKILGKCLDTQCLIKAAPTASVIYKLLPGEAPHSSKVYDLKLHWGRCEFRPGIFPFGVCVYVWLWPCKASGPEASKQAPDPCFRLIIPAPTRLPPPSEVASVLYLDHSHSKGNWQGARSSFDLFEGILLIRGTDLEGSNEAQVHCRVRAGLLHSGTHQYTSSSLCWRRLFCAGFPYVYRYNILSLLSTPLYIHLKLRGFLFYILFTLLLRNAS